MDNLILLESKPVKKIIYDEKQKLISHTDIEHIHHYNKDVQSIYIDEADLQHLDRLDILIGGSTIVELNKEILAELPVNEKKIEILNKFIEYVPRSKFIYFVLRIVFHFNDGYDKVHDCEPYRQFKYMNYDEECYYNNGYTPDAFVYYKQCYVNSLNLYIKFCDKSDNENEIRFFQPVYTNKEKTSYELKENILAIRDNMASPKFSY